MNNTLLPRPVLSAARLKRHRPLSIIAASLATALTAGCSNPGEDVRVTLCKDMTLVQLGAGANPNWTQATTETPGYEDAVVRLRWSNAGDDGQARCYYPYNAVEDTAQQIADPLTAYATSPSKMTINGRTLSGQALADVVAQAMQHQGKQLLDSAKKLIEQ